jgi:hypothetical protein
MEIWKNSLTDQQKAKLKKLWEMYGDGSMKASYGNSSLLQRLILEDDIEIISLLYDEINFYVDISVMLLGDIINICLQKHISL